MRNNKLKNSACLTLCILMLAWVCVGIPRFRAAGEESKTEVNVGYFDLADYYKLNPDNTIDSYDSAYLNAVEGYTDLHFNYVNCGNWDNALDMLESHAIDLIGTMQWNQEREYKYDICDASYGYTIAELAAKSDSGYIYEDYEGINGATVGFIEGYVIEGQLHELMDKMNLTFTIKTYSTQTQLENALETGEIDLIAANSHAIRNDWVLIEKFSYAPMYFASWKGNADVVSAISEALIKIKLYDPEFDDKLVKQYFGTMANSPYNKQELELINNKKVYTVYFDTDTKPLAWYDKKSDTMFGVLVDVCSNLEKITGLRFEYKPYYEGADYDADNAVFYSLVDAASVPTESSSSISEPIADFEFSLYHKAGKSFDYGNGYSIAYVKNRGTISDYLSSEFPTCTAIAYDTPAECLKLVNSGKVDLAFVNTSIAEYVITTESMNNIVSLPTTNEMFGIALRFEGADATLRAGIVNKGIKLSDDTVLNRSMLKYALGVKPTANLAYYIQNYPVTVFIVALTIIIMAGIFVTLVFYARLMKKDKLRTEALSRERADFFSRMSHDMRTPMNGILGLTDLSKDETDAETLKATLKKIDESGQYLLGLINDSLDYQKIESGSMQLVNEVVSTKELIETSIQMIYGNAEKKGVTFRLVNKNAQLDGYVRTDAMRIRQLFVNLLSNAVKFTPSGGSVEMSFEVMNRAPNKVSDRIVVSDTGIGMSEEFIKNKLFKPFAQENNGVTSQYAGTGLGLSIVKQIVDLMGASIRVESKPGEGSKFIVDIDFETVDADVAANLIKQKEKINVDALAILNGKRILLAEDHPLNAEIAQKILAKKGCSTVWTKDGKECLDAFSTSSEWSFDAVLMDIRMPVLDGLKAASAIRALDRTDAKRIPIIAMSANAYAEDVKKSLDSGMNAHLAKPVQPDKLYETLAAELEKRE